MIPLRYRLREGIQFEKRADRWLVISEAPLNILRVGEKGARLLRACNGKRSLQELAVMVDGLSERAAFLVCEYFRGKAILLVKPLPGNSDYWPSVSVIIPTRDRKKDLIECLEGIFKVEYPHDRVEVIVVDDGSGDGTAEALAAYPCTVLTQRESRGQSFCRNLGASEAHGDILAFLDSDCIPEKGWLQDLVPYFHFDSVAVVGGFVDGYLTETALDRYEKTCSSLNIGGYLLRGTLDNSTMYVPTCNMLVRRGVYHQSGGTREEMHVGEDVDLCWRIRGMGQEILYVPSGVVKHKHRSTLVSMLLRKAQYGTSEALLYRLHPEKRKVFPMAPFPLVTFVLAVVSFLYPSAMLPAGTAIAVFITVDALLRAGRIFKLDVWVSWWKVVYSTMRTHIAFAHVASFHLVRYYLILFLLFGLVYGPLAVFGITLLLFSALWDYRLKKPALMFHVFLWFYALEHMAYQLGVFVGCLREKTFMSYVPKFEKKAHRRRPDYERRDGAD